MKEALLAVLVTTGKIAVAIAAVFAVLYALTSIEHCDTTRSTSLISPDGKWTALTHETMCEGFGGPVSTSIEVRLTLISTTAPERRRDMFELNTYSGPDDWPQVQWSSSNVQNVRVADMHFLTVLRKQYRDVLVNVSGAPPVHATR